MSVDRTCETSVALHSPLMKTLAGFQVGAIIRVRSDWCKTVGRWVGEKSLRTVIRRMVIRPFVRAFERQRD